MLHNVLLFFVFTVWIGNGISELHAQKKEKSIGWRKTLAWTLGIVLPTLLAGGVAIWYWPF